MFLLEQTMPAQESRINVIILGSTVSPHADPCCEAGITIARGSSTSTRPTRNTPGRRYELTKATQMLQQLSVPLPNLPPYDPTNDEPFPWEAEVRALLEATPPSPPPLAR